MWLFVLFVSVWPCEDWRPVQGVPRLLPDDRWDRLQPPRDPTDGLSGYRKWMEIIFYLFVYLSNKIIEILGNIVFR